jgi:hypothetical protein
MLLVPFFLPQASMAKVLVELTLQLNLFSDQALVAAISVAVSRPDLFLGDLFSPQSLVLWSNRPLAMAMWFHLLSVDPCPPTHTEQIDNAKQ